MDAHPRSVLAPLALLAVGLATGCFDVEALGGGGDDLAVPIDAAAPADAALVPDESTDPGDGSVITVDSSVGTTDGTLPVPPDLVQVCIPQAREDCTNGVDDDCDGPIDCADPGCGGSHACLPEFPGWLASILLPAGASCPPEFPTRLDVHSGLGPSAPRCTGCRCAPPPYRCCGPFNVWQTGGCLSGAPSPVEICTDQCTGIGIAAGASVQLGSLYLAQGGASCMPMGPPVPPAPQWSSDHVLCTASMLGGGCPAGSRCTPVPQNSGARCVVYDAGVPMACPPGYFNPVTYYESYNGGFGCGMCSCTAASGGCMPPMGSAQALLYGNMLCPGGVPASKIDQVNCTLLAGGYQGAVRLDQMGLSAPSCAPVLPMVTNGNITPDRPHTVCCTQ